MRLLLVLLVLCPAIAWPQAQPMKTASMFIFQSGLALTLKEGNLHFDKNRVLIEDLPGALFHCFWLNPVGDYHILKTVYGADTILSDAEARTFYEVLKANVGKEARVTYKIGNEIEDVEGEILTFGIGSDLARIRRATGGTIFIHKDQVMMVSINDNMPRSLYKEMQIGNSTAVEIDKSSPNATLQALYFQKGYNWEPAYSLNVTGDRTAQLSMKAVITSQGDDVDPCNIKLVLGSPHFRSDKGIDASLRELVSSLPAFAFPKPISTHNLVQVVTGTETDINGNQARATLNPDLLGHYGQTQPGEVYIMDAGYVSLKRNSKAYLPVFTKDVAIQQDYRCTIPNFVDTLDTDKLGTPAYPIDVYHSLSMPNTMDLPLLEGGIYVAEASGTVMGQTTVPYTTKGDTVMLRLARLQRIQAVTYEEVFSIEPKFRLEDKTIADRIIVRGFIELKNTDKRPIILNIDKEVTGILTRKGGALSKVTGQYNGRNPIQRMAWSIPLAGNTDQRIIYEYVIFR